MINSIKKLFNSISKNDNLVFYKTAFVILLVVFAITLFNNNETIPKNNKNYLKNKQENKITKEQFNMMVEEELSRVLDGSSKSLVSKNKNMLNITSEEVEVEPLTNSKNSFSNNNFFIKNEKIDPMKKLNYISHERFNEWKKDKDVVLDKSTIEFSNNNIKEAKKEKRRKTIIDKVKEKNTMAILLPSIIPDDVFNKNKSINNIAGYIARKYQLDYYYAKKITEISFDAADSYSLDPKLVLAFIAEQSSFNPLAGGVAGGKGLTQIVPRWFNIDEELLSSYNDDKEKTISEHRNDLVNIENNIVVGVSVFKSLMEDNNNSIKKSLMHFNKVDEKTAQKLESIVNNIYLKLKQAEDGKIQPVRN